MVASCNSEEEAHTNNFMAWLHVLWSSHSFFSAREAHPGKGEATGVQDKNKSESILPCLAFLDLRGWLVWLSRRVPMSPMTSMDGQRRTW